MSTRAMFGILNNDGTIEASYVHWAGGLDAVGAILKENYTQKRQIRALLKLGDLSTLGKTPAECIAYHRDFKEPMMEHKYEDENEYLDDSMLSDAEFTYLFKQNRWLVNGGRTGREWVEFEQL